MLRTALLTGMVVAVACGAALADECQVGNLGYNSYEGALSKGEGLDKSFGPGVGYQSDNGDQFRRYIPADEWGRFGYGTGHLGEGYGPYIYGRRKGPSPPGLFDPLEPAYKEAPPPRIKVSNGRIRVAMRNDLPGVTCVTVTLVAFNNAELACQSLKCPPFNFDFPVMDGCKSLRVRIDYNNDGLSATSYPL